VASIKSALDINNAGAAPRGCAALSTDTLSLLPDWLSKRAQAMV
jgi:hypothetical protein